LEKPLLQCCFGHHEFHRKPQGIELEVYDEKVAPSRPSYVIDVKEAGNSITILEQLSVCECVLWIM
jgi:hypothetical protein